jgi:glucosamine--fructose-6-phosphate aminotransferase (isomerizing)
MTGELMRAEMHEQPAILERFVGRFDEHVEAVRAVAPRELAGVAFLARGSSDNVSIYGRYLAEMATGRPASLVAPSLHTLYGIDVDYTGWLLVALSQSGETPEIATVCRRLGEAGARTIAVVNKATSSVGEAAELVIPLAAGPERAVPATKTVTAQFLAVAAIAATLGEVPFGERDLEELPAAVGDVLADFEAAEALAEQWNGAERAFVAARGLLLAAALEIALKIKETTGILAEGISAADLRHGPIAAAGAGAPLLLLDDGGPTAADIGELGALAAVRGGCVARWSTPPGALAVIPAAVRGQQLALALAERRRLDPDAPIGLSKVTPTS